MLFHPPSKAGQLNKDVFAQANYGDKYKRIVIYVDGTINFKDIRNRFGNQL